MRATLPAWYVVQTQPHAESKAASHLGRQGYSIYLPQYLKRRRHARRVEIVLRPLFPSYLFVHLDPLGCRWRSINGTIGVREILSNGESPLCVPDHVVNEIKAREDEAGAVRLVPPSFARGQSVRLTEGPLAEMSGLFEEMRDEDRAILLISLLGRQVRMQVSLTAVAAV